MAPTTLIGQKTTTTQSGRQADIHGYPLRVSEILVPIEGVKYLERTQLTTAESVQNTKRAIKKSFQAQIDKKGFSLIEILSACPTNWGMDTRDCFQHITENLVKTFPLGVIKDNL